MKYQFSFLDKQCAEKILPILFKILYSNMSVIAPTGNTYEQDFQLWQSSVAPALSKQQRQIVLMHSDDEIVGYFQYYVNDNVFMMEEIQIISNHQGTGLFRLFFMWLIDKLNKDIKFIEAYSHKNNTKSQNILKHLGLQSIGMNKNGNSYHYRGDFNHFVNVFIL